ncbi:MAG: hypothetical protein AAF670_14340 [Planctomycetota bacterium]
MLQANDRSKASIRRRLRIIAIESAEPRQPFAEATTDAASWITRRLGIGWTPVTGRSD